MTIPALPAQGSTAWYAHYAAMDAAHRSLGYVWTRDVDLPLNTLTGITTSGSTWSIDVDGHLKVDSAANAFQVARIDSLLGAPANAAPPAFASEVEVEFGANWGTGDSVSLAFGDDGVLAAGNVSASGRVSNGAPPTAIFYLGTTVINLPVTPDVSLGWHTMRLVYADSVYRLWLDGVLLGTSGAFYPPSTNSLRASLWVYGIATWRFRNLKVWSGAPAEPVLP